MLFKKNKAIISAFLATAMAVQMVVPTAAAGHRTKDEAYGDESYAARFLSLYQDVITEGDTNGYLSGKNAPSGGFGVPYHAVEKIIVEAPDFGHETTSEAMSYISWVAAMHDNLITNVDEAKSLVTASGKQGMEMSDLNLEAAWKTMEVMIPTGQKSTVAGSWWDMADADHTTTESQNFYLKAGVAPEFNDVEAFTAAFEATDYGDSGALGEAYSPLYQYHKKAYSGDTAALSGTREGVYLMHWLADVDNWYGYGGTGTKFTFINSFQRGEQESVWETVPHPSIEVTNNVEGKDAGSFLKIFAPNSNASQWDQWRYTNAPDAEDRAIQGVFSANRWGVGSDTVSSLAGKMSDHMRNDMFDKYYQKIGINGGAISSAKNTSLGAESGQHYLMAWYTAWGADDDSGKGVSWDKGWAFAWQIGASQAHEFYQNPMAAYGKVYDTEINSGMKEAGADDDWNTSLERQLELYEYLQSAEGAFAGGVSNNAPDANGIYAYGAYPPGISTFHDMAYTPHPVYADPGSNHWIGNQVWAVQRLMELMYVTNPASEAVNGETLYPDPDTYSRLEKMMDKWVSWCLTYEEEEENGIVMSPLTIDLNGDNPTIDPELQFTIAENLDWAGTDTTNPNRFGTTNQPDSWTGSPSENSNLHATLRDYANGDVGCIASMANCLIWYAAAKGVSSDNVNSAEIPTDLGERALWSGRFLMDKLWNNWRDDIGVGTPPGGNGSMWRMFEQEVSVPTSYSSSKYPYITNGATFIDLRPGYEGVVDENYGNVDYTINGEKWDGATFAELEAAWEAADGVKDGQCSQDAQDEISAAVPFVYHRFWHEGDVLMTLGTLSTYYPEITPAGVIVDEVAPNVTPNPVTVAPLEYFTLTVDNEEKDVTWTYDEDALFAKPEDVTGSTIRLRAADVGTYDIVVTDKYKNATTVTVNVINGSVDPTTPEPTPEPTDPPVGGENVLRGDVNLDRVVKIADLVDLCKHVVGVTGANLTGPALAAADCDVDADVDGQDALELAKYLVKKILSFTNPIVPDAYYPEA